MHIPPDDSRGLLERNRSLLTGRSKKAGLIPPRSLVGAAVSQLSCGTHIASQSGGAHDH